MVGENFEIHSSEMSKYAVFRRNTSTMVGENFEIHSSKMSKHAVLTRNTSTMVGENFEIQSSEMFKNEVLRRKSSNHEYYIIRSRTPDSPPVTYKDVGGGYHTCVTVITCV